MNLEEPLSLSVQGRQHEDFSLFQMTTWLMSFEAEIFGVQTLSSGSICLFPILLFLEGSTYSRNCLRLTCPA